MLLSREFQLPRGRFRVLPIVRTARAIKQDDITIRITNAILRAGLHGQPFFYFSSFLPVVSDSAFAPAADGSPSPDFFRILPGGFRSVGIVAGVLHDDRNAPVRRVQRILRVTQALVRKARTCET